MSIYMKSLSPETYYALEKLRSEFGWVDIYEYMEPELIAYLACRLKFVPDNADYFPKGKWATIQRLQDLVDEHAKEEVSKIFAEKEARK